MRHEVTAREASERARAAAATVRRNRQTMREQEGRRRRELDRVTRWQKENPDRVREKRQRWEENHPDRRRQASRDYYQRNRDQILARQKEKHYADPSVRQKRQQQYRRQHPDRVAASNKKWRSQPGNEERHQELTKRWKRRERRRQELGLPARRLHRQTPAEVQTGAHAADVFFHRNRPPQELTQLRVELLEPTPPELLDAWDTESARARLRHRLRNDPEFRDRVAHRRDALHARETARGQRAARFARQEAIARAINDRLRTSPRRAGYTDPAAPSVTPPAGSSPGLGR